MTDLREQLAAIVYDPTNGTAATDKALATAQDLIDSGLVPQWQPIETAPDRGGDFLVYQPSYKQRRMTLAARVCPSSNAGYTRKSTHWFPYPAAPGVQGGEE